MTQQDDIWRDQQARWEREGRQVYCDRCGEYIRALDLQKGERHPNEAVCDSCRSIQKEDAEGEAEWAWDEAWVALYEAALREDEYRRMV